MRLSRTATRGTIAATLVLCALAVMFMSQGGRAQAATPKSLWVGPPSSTQCISVVVTRPDAEEVRWAIESFSADIAPLSKMQRGGLTYVDTGKQLLANDAVEVSAWSGQREFAPGGDTAGSCTGDRVGYLAPFLLPDVPEFLLVVN